ncbi:metal-dependent hydrolase [Sphingobium lactosutens]|uniref:metal-dependent hydrolase n=1 Tax=Sphingobium lactosutens TaxID=522773 RepID=UPI0015BCC55A|nr:metal-dependent hydrolase [Sphingobium lactosutens]
MAPSRPSRANINAWSRQWHVAEEFEHCATCHKAFKAVSGNYFVRLAGLAYSFWHIHMLFDLATRIVLEVYRADMAPAERRASIKREKRLARRQLGICCPNAAACDALI